MNATPPVFEVKPMRGWRKGKNTRFWGCYDTNPGLIDEGPMGWDPIGKIVNKDPLNNGINSHVDNENSLHTNFRNIIEPSVPDIERDFVGFNDGNIYSAWRNNRDGLLPHMNGQGNSPTFLKFSRPPVFENDNTEWVATVEFESELVGEWCDTWPIEDERPGTDGIFSGDRRTVMYRNISDANSARGHEFPNAGQGNANIDIEPVP